jgi:hypothetical protein
VISLCALCGSLLRRPVELGPVDPHAVENDRELARDSNLSFAEPIALGATKRARRTKRRTWSKADVRELKAYSRSKSPVKKKIAKVMKRTVGALRQKALSLGLPLGHRR